MAAQVGGEQLTKKGINGPKALLELPWDVDGENDNIPTDEEVDQLQEEMNSINAQLKEKAEE